MIRVLRQHLLQRLGGRTTHLDTVLSHFRPKSLAQGHDLVRRGEKCEGVFFLVEGCLQVYTISPQGTESTRDIVLPGSWCSELSSFRSGTGAVESIRAVKDCALLEIRKEAFDSLLASVPQFAEIYQRLLHDSYTKSVDRLNTMIALSASERMAWLEQNRPELIGKVSSRLIASYLGISAETYSRLKPKLEPN